MKKEKKSIFREKLKENFWLSTMIADWVGLSINSITNISKTWKWNLKNKEKIMKFLILKNMELKEYAKKVEWLCIDFDKEYGHQFVALIRHYAQNVLKFNLWVFGGSAKTGWFNRVNTFDKKFFDKIIFTKNWEIPPEGAILFSKMNTTWWHVSIVLEATADYITVLEQNVGSWDWKWTDDCVKISKINYNEVVGWYIFKNQEIKKEPTEFEKLLEEAKNLGIWNWKNVDKPATRWEVAVMC